MTPLQRRALTLLEVVIAVAIMGLLFGALLAFYWQTIDIRDRTVWRSDRTQLARQVLARIESEIRGCIGFKEIRFPVEQRLAGDRRSITFLTTQLPDHDQYRLFDADDDLPPAQHDLTLVSYRLWVNDDEEDEDGNPIVAGIIRSEKQTLNQFVVEEDDPLQIRHDLWAPELKYLEFRYFDGVEWTTKWDLTEGNSLPHMVMVTIGYEPLTLDEHEDNDLEEFPVDQYPFGDETEHTDRYRIIVRVPAADLFFSTRFERVGKQVADQFGLEGAAP